VGLSDTSLPIEEEIVPTAVGCRDGGCILARASLLAAALDLIMAQHYLQVINQPVSTRVSVNGFWMSDRFFNDGGCVFFFARQQRLYCNLYFKIVNVCVVCEVVAVNDVCDGFWRGRWH
jgi:hypothetical protein